MLSEPKCTRSKTKREGIPAIKPVPLQVGSSQIVALTLLRMISGARYSGVPHNVHVLPLTRLAKPKSVTCGRVEGGSGDAW